MKIPFRFLLRLALLGLLFTAASCRRTPKSEGNGLDPAYDPGLGGINGPTGFEIDGPTELSSRGSISDMEPVDSSAYAPVYFAFDSSTVAPGELFKVQSVATYLQGNPGHAVILEGHTDERGSREYNLALGERRALAVREVLMSYGVSPDRIQTLSLGEEQPAVAGFDESAWSLNRRVDFQLMR